jgi:glutamate-1-semialdehyde 2,1-aminomutase
MPVAGFTSTGSKRPEALYGVHRDGVPLRMIRSSGCTVRGSDGRDYLDCIMALGAVALGYGHPDVNGAVITAVQQGSIGPLSPDSEPALADDLAASIPWIDEVRFLKTGAEAVAAAVRLARVATGRERMLGCGYHGWLDWCSDAAGVPAAVRALYDTLPFNDIDATTRAIRDAGDALAGVVIEPVIDRAPDPEWLAALRAETARVGAVLIFDEIKTAFRLAPAAAADRWHVQPDLLVLGKALANGFPLAAVAGPSSMMRHVTETWISSTMATEFVSIAAARATLRVMAAEHLSEQLFRAGQLFWSGLEEIAGRHPVVVSGVAGLPEMCYLRYRDDAIGARVSAVAAQRGLLFKRSAYNFVSLAHDPAMIQRILERLEAAIGQVEDESGPDAR